MVHHVNRLWPNFGSKVASLLHWVKSLVLRHSFFMVPCLELSFIDQVWYLLLPSVGKIAESSKGGGKSPRGERGSVKTRKQKELRRKVRMYAWRPSGVGCTPGVPPVSRPLGLRFSLLRGRRGTMCIATGSDVHSLTHSLPPAPHLTSAHSD